MKMWIKVRCTELMPYIFVRRCAVSMRTFPYTRVCEEPPPPFVILYAKIIYLLYPQKRQYMAPYIRTFLQLWYTILPTRVYIKMYGILFDFSFLLQDRCVQNA